MKKELAKKLNKIVKEISANKKVMAIYLFGSQVNGRAREDSDVDIAVILKNPTWKDEWKISYNDGLFDIHAFSRLPLIIQFRIFRDGKLLFIRDKDFVRQIYVRTIREYLDFEPFITKYYWSVLKNV